MSGIPEAALWIGGLILYAMGIPLTWGWGQRKEWFPCNVKLYPHTREPMTCSSCHAGLPEVAVFLWPLIWLWMYVITPIIKPLIKTFVFMSKAFAKPFLRIGRGSNYKNE